MGMGDCMVEWVGVTWERQKKDPGWLTRAKSK